MVNDTTLSESDAPDDAAQDNEVETESQSETRGDPDDAPGAGDTASRDESASGASSEPFAVAEGTPAFRIDTQRCRLPTPPPLGALDLITAFPGTQFERPLWFGFAPLAEDQAFTVQQNGQIWTFDPETPAEQTLFLGVDVRRINNEEGLLALAFHPQYSENGRFFIYYSASNPTRVVLSELQRHAADPNLADPGTERVLLEIQQPFGNHNGGDMHFGADGYLYLSIGDGGSAGDPRNYAQDPHSLLGAIIRIDVDNEDAICGTPYGIPDDNPFALGRCVRGQDTAGAPEVWAWGLRNVWRMSFDSADGRLWAADVGQDSYEEINIIEAGKNYGWRPMEGPTCFIEPCDPADFELPLYAYGHDVGKSVTGGVIYRGSEFPELWGQYIFGDYNSGRIWALAEGPNGEADVTLLSESARRISSFGVDPMGEIYVVSFDGGIERFSRRDSSVAVEPFPQTLTETGCFDDVASHRESEGVIPYEVQVPFWSDHTRKLRRIALPVGESMTYRDEGSYGMPTGTVVLKTFLLADESGEERRIETRIIHKGMRGWKGYSYRWNDAQTEATLLHRALDAPVSGPNGPQIWHFPSRAECNHCHVERHGYALGLSTRQLNDDILLQGQTVNQLTAMHAGELVMLPREPVELPQHPKLKDTDAEFSDVARAVLDVNCAVCHQADGTANTALDLRAHLPLEDTRTCGVAPERGDLGINGALLIDPGHPENSILLERMRIRGRHQMPPKYSSIVDTYAVNLIGAWIQGLQSCP